MAKNRNDILKGLWQPFTQMKTYKKYEMQLIQKSNGHYVYDVNGKEFLDATSSLWNVILGHGIKEIHEAMMQQLATLEYSTLFRATNTAAVKLAEQITSLLPDPLNYAFLTSNGSESVEVAIKMARQYFNQDSITSKNKIISLKRAYHGVSYGALSASGFEEDQLKFGPMVPGFVKIEPPYCYRCPFKTTYPECALLCAEHLENVIKEENPDTIAAFIMEPVMGFGGVIVPPKEYMQKVSDICKKYGLLFILDEVTTGFGRTGRLFAFKHFNIQPDIICFGKAMSGGYAPLGATVATSTIYERFFSDNVDHRFNDGSTNSGHPVCCAAGIATINYMLKNDVLARAKQKREQFLKKLMELEKYNFVGDIRGIGSMVAIEFVENKESKQSLRGDAMTFILRGLFSSGVWVHSGGNMIYIMPAITFDDEHYTKVLTTLDKVFRLTQEMFKF